MNEANLSIGSFSKQAPDDLVDGLRRLGVASGDAGDERRGHGPSVLAGELRETAAPERRPGRDHLEQDNAERVKVRQEVDGLGVAELLGCYVDRRAQKRQAG